MRRLGGRPDRWLKLAHVYVARKCCSSEALMACLGRMATWKSMASCQRIDDSGSRPVERLANIRGQTLVAHALGSRPRRCARRVVGLLGLGPICRFASCTTSALPANMWAPGATHMIMCCPTCRCRSCFKHYDKLLWTAASQSHRCRLWSHSSSDPSFVAGPRASHQRTTSWAILFSSFPPSSPRRSTPVTSSRLLRWTGLPQSTIPRHGPVRLCFGSWWTEERGLRTLR